VAKHTEQPPLDALLETVRELRSEHGCPWDREQTHASLKPCLVEETYEVLDAVDSGDPAPLREELGDLLLQVVMHAQLRAETGDFDFHDVARTVNEKLIRRHPHVFGDVQVDGTSEVLRNWNEIKKDEGRRTAALLDGIPRSFPALLRAHQVQKKVAQVGFDWDTRDGVIDKIEEELEEVREAMGEAAGNTDHVQEELGDLLFSMVNLCRYLGFHAEECLNQTIEKFIARFNEVERRVCENGQRLSDCTLEELDAAWNDVKRGPVS
jgi:tetrapyrrole methylase family protein/MazG family protein